MPKQPMDYDGKNRQDQGYNYGSGKKNPVGKMGNPSPSKDMPKSPKKKSPKSLA